jgi:hypothetical protein
LKRNKQGVSKWSRVVVVLYWSIGHFWYSVGKTNNSRVGKMEKSEQKINSEA